MEAQAREVRKDIMKRAGTGETIQIATIKAHFDGWLTSKKAWKAEAAGKRHGMAVDAFWESLGKLTRLEMGTRRAAVGKIPSFG